MTEDKKKILVIGGVDRRSIALRLGGALDLGPAVVVATRNEGMTAGEARMHQKLTEAWRNLGPAVSVATGREVGDFNNVPKRAFSNAPPSATTPTAAPPLTLEPMERNPTPAGVVRHTPPESRLRKARAALALASMITGSLPPGMFVREDLRAGRCTHKFGLAGGFSSCAVCGIKTKKERNT